MTLTDIVQKMEPHLKRNLNYLLENNSNTALRSVAHKNVTLKASLILITEYDGGSLTAFASTTSRFVSNITSLYYVQRSGNNIRCLKCKTSL